MRAMTATLWPSSGLAISFVRFATELRSTKLTRIHRLFSEDLEVGAVKCVA
jgi:hypothetical protein